MNLDLNDVKQFQFYGFIHSYREVIESFAF